MAAPIEISYHRFEPTEEVRDKLEALLGQIEKYEPYIVDGRIVVDGTNHQGAKTVVEIGVELNLKGYTAIGKRTAEFPSPAGQRSFGRAATEAFRVAIEQVRDHVSMQQGATKTLDHALQRGRILSLDRNVENGFIEMPDGSSLFFASAVVRNASFNELVEGATVMVRVDDEEGPYGPQAADVEAQAPEVRAR